MSLGGFGGTVVEESSRCVLCGLDFTELHLLGPVAGVQAMHFDAHRWDIIARMAEFVRQGALAIEDEPDANTVALVRQRERRRLALRKDLEEFNRVAGTATQGRSHDRRNEE